MGADCFPQFQVRFSPALAQKPKSNKSYGPEKPFDPFLDPPKSLLVTEFRNYNLVLNKFPVIPDHFILATKEFKEQTDLLEAEDLGAAYVCLRTYCDEGEELFGFFNSGEHSGASQPHRHIQFLPVESMRIGMEQKEEWSPLADILTSTTQTGNKPPHHWIGNWLIKAGTKGRELPFAYFHKPIQDNMSAPEIHNAYKYLLGAAQSASEGRISSISYNLGLTSKSMVLIPRRSEGSTIESVDGSIIGPVALNGTILAGTLLVKTEAEWSALRTDTSKLKDVLEAIGIHPFRSTI